MTEAYPLRWPEGWPKTPRDQRSRGYQFKRRRYADDAANLNATLPTFASGRDDVVAELQRFDGVSSVVISSSVDVRYDGVPRKGVNPDRQYGDPGVAVYFMRHNIPHVIAQDAYDTPGVNLRSLALALEAMRAVERHGGRLMMNKAFDGFAALPPPAGSRPKRPWWDVLKYDADPTEREFLTVGEVEARARGLARKAHPDAGGSDELMSEINVARDEAIEELRGAQGE